MKRNESEDDMQQSSMPWPLDQQTAPLKLMCYHINSIVFLLTMQTRSQIRKQLLSSQQCTLTAPGNAEHQSLLCPQKTFWPTITSRWKSLRVNPVSPIFTADDTSRMSCGKLPTEMSLLGLIIASWRPSVQWFNQYEHFRTDYYSYSDERENVHSAQIDLRLWS